MTKFTHCPKCGGALEYRTIEEGAPNKEPVCTACGFIFWQNSKPTVSALIQDDAGNVLLIERGIEPKKGEWDLPGGFVGNGEDADVALKREMREELSVDVLPQEIIGIYTDIYGPEEYATFNVVYIATIKEGEIKAASDVVSTAWFALDALPEKVAFRCIEEALDALLVRDGREQQYAG